MFAQIDHVGVAVDDLDAAIALHEQTYGLALAHREVVEEQGVEAVLLDVGESHVELLRPLQPDTAVGRFLASRGPGLHHVAYRVERHRRGARRAPRPRACSSSTRRPARASATRAWPSSTRGRRAAC